jgi:hypothetical protein
MLSEHSSDRLGFPIRKEGKNADLIGKEPLWIYIMILLIANGSLSKLKM